MNPFLTGLCLLLVSLLQFGLLDEQTDGESRISQTLGVLKEVILINERVVACTEAANDLRDELSIRVVSTASATVVVCSDVLTYNHLIAERARSRASASLILYCDLRWSNASFGVSKSRISPRINGST